MKKILMRAAMNPLNSLDSAKVIANNMIGDNTGNLLFVHSVMRTLMCEDITIDTILTYRDVSEERMERINAEYDCFVMPLANAFRKTFREELRCLTQFVKRLKMPCVVIGVGVQNFFNKDINDKFEFDDDVKAFVKAVLEKSSMIGIRGEITSAYLKKLGFQEEKDYTIIGCPAMYMQGDHLELKQPKELRPESLVSVNRKIDIPKKLHRFIVKSSKKFENYMFVPQGIDDLRLLYLGISIPDIYKHSIPRSYPSTVDSKIYVSGKEIGFTNVQSWLDFLSQRDFSFGSRIHGNIAAVLAGIPVFIFAPDTRILELAQYHNIQHIVSKEIDENTDIFQLYEKADFDSVLRGHKERFYHYLDFLEVNGLEHVFGTGRTNRETPFDRELATLHFPGGITPYTHLSWEQKMMRKVKYRYYIKKEEYRKKIRR